MTTSTDSINAPTLTIAMRWHRPLMFFAATMALLALVSAAGVLFDDQMLVGARIWLKPLKFAISFALYSVTLAWMLSFVTRGRRVANAAATAIAIAGAAEVGLIVAQVIRGTRSHFNVATDFDNNVWIAMGVTIGVLWAATFVVAIMVFLAKVADPASRWAIRLGITLSLIGMALGGLMLRATPAQQEAIAADSETVVGAHSVGVEDGGPSMPFTGWSTTGGDLRIGHFIGLHALQILPLLAILLGVLARRFNGDRGWDAVRRLRVVLLGGGAYAGLIVLVTWQALRGQPLLAPDRYTAIAAVGLVVATLVGGYLAVTLPVRHRQDVSSTS